MYEVSTDNPVSSADCRKLALGVVITTQAQGGKPKTARTMPCQVISREGEEMYRLIYASFHAPSSAPSSVLAVSSVPKLTGKSTLMMRVWVITPQSSCFMFLGAPSERGHGGSAGERETQRRAEPPSPQDVQSRRVPSQATAPPFLHGHLLERPQGLFVRRSRYTS